MTSRDRYLIVFVLSVLLLGVGIGGTIESVVRSGPHKKEIAYAYYSGKMSGMAKTHAEVCSFSDLGEPWANIFEYGCGTGNDRIILSPMILDF